MATPMTAAQVVAQLKKWGLGYVEIPGWATHNRNAKGAWGPVNGFVWHHTGATIAAASARTYAAGTLYNGRSDLPGPLCQFSIGVDGTLFLVGWGRANHAGGGDPAVLAHVVNEDYTTQLKPTKGNSDGVDGNARFYGVEIQYSGSQPMAPVQYATALRLSAALCDWHGWSEKSVIAHGEWSDDKWDPGYAPGKVMAMPAVRADVKTTLIAGPNPIVSEEDAVPDFVSLGVSVPMPLTVNTWSSLVFDKEHTDEPGGHAAGGKAFVAGPAKYSGEVNVHLTGVPEGKAVQVRIAETVGADTPATLPITEIVGTAGGTFGTVPFTGSVASGRKLTVQVNPGPLDGVVVATAKLRAQVWPTA